MRECGKSNTKGNYKVALEQSRQGILSRAVGKLSQKKQYLHWTLKDEQALSGQRWQEGYSRQKEWHANSKSDSVGAEGAVAGATGTGGRAEHS